MKRTFYIDSTLFGTQYLDSMESLYRILFPSDIEAPRILFASLLPLLVSVDRPEDALCELLRVRAQTTYFVAFFEADGEFTAHSFRDVATDHPRHTVFKGTKAEMLHRKLKDSVAKKEPVA